LDFYKYIKKDKDGILMAKQEKLNQFKKLHGTLK